MHISSALVTAATALGIAFATPFTAHAADGLAPHENTYRAPDGFEFTVGHTGHAAHPVGSLNGMPANREVFLDNTSYARLAGGTGTLKAGYFVACAVDIDVKFSANAGASLDAGANAGVSVSPDAVSPSAGITIGPSVSAGIGVNLSLGPGKITEVKVGEKALTPGDTAYLVSRDFHVMVQGCGGPLTVRAYSIIEVSSPAVDGNGAVFGDPIVL
ncbi:hypothetical protein BJY24_003588 [Nocardia transvalensis]|uniref:MspA protein n=1 Tax=Nocardia transvalensis TaxID=37333 RepID=A0A7W9PEW3_9NOCA|nr:MspA family porin [Nocardia transvalensis]MBB5914721.1 hypothetical protein [Nocardia transvalensis]